MDFEDDTIDPAMAAAMGFTSFGGAQNKRRKVHRNNDDGDGFIDPEIAKSNNPPAKLAPGTGANSVKTGPRRPAAASAQDAANATTAAGVVPAAGESNVAASGSTAQVSGASPAFSTATHGGPTAGAQGGVDQNRPNMRKGVRNENGDMVFFKPSFLEDPWRHLGDAKRA
jgi:hypothetical protein